MANRKSVYFHAANICRGLAICVENWVILLLAVSVISPISLHVKLPRALIHDSCTYAGVRGIIYETDYPCPVIRLIDTREHEGLLW